MSLIEVYVVGTLEEVRQLSDGMFEVDIMTEDGSVETVLLTPEGYKDLVEQYGVPVDSLSPSEQSTKN